MTLRAPHVPHFDTKDNYSRHASETRANEILVDRLSYLLGSFFLYSTKGAFSDNKNKGTLCFRGKQSHLRIGFYCHICMMAPLVIVTVWEKITFTDGPYTVYASARSPWPQVEPEGTRP